MYVGDLCLKSFLGCSIHAGEKVKVASKSLLLVFTLLVATVQHFKENTSLSYGYHEVEDFDERLLIDFEILQGHYLQDFN